MNHDNITPARAATVPGGRHLAVVALAAATALALVFFMVSSVTGAAWTDTTSNASNSWSTGSVSLTDDDAGVAMFTTNDMLPGDTTSNLITVTNASTVPLDVKLYGANVADTDGLAQYLNFKVGTTDGGFEVYTGTAAGTLAGFQTAHVDYASGTSVISLAAGATQTYYFWVELDANAPDSAQGDTAGIDFVWEGHTQ